MPAPDVPGPSPAELGARLADLVRPLGAGRPRFALLDFPSHGNIGDSAIWVGEIALFARLYGRRPDHVSHMRFDPAAPGRALPAADAVLYLHGGGNFGDIWPKHQTYREAVIAANPQHRIVQLPQSIHYRDPAGVERTRRIIAAHPDFHLMVRDAESRDFAQRHFDCPVILAPDSAFCIDPAAFPRPAAAQGTLCLFRTDQERRPDARGAGARFPGARIEDWRREADWRRQAHKALLAVFYLMPDGPLAGPRAASFTAMARRRVALGLDQIDSAARVVTDRLHGHILARLLGKPQIVIDNEYGKIRRYIAAWGGGDTRIARDFAEAAEMAAGA